MCCKCFCERKTSKLFVRPRTCSKLLVWQLVYGCKKRSLSRHPTRHGTSFGRSSPEALSFASASELLLLQTLFVTNLNLVSMDIVLLCCLDQHLSWSVVSVWHWAAQTRRSGLGHPASSVILTPLCALILRRAPCQAKRIFHTFKARIRLISFRPLGL